MGGAKSNVLGVDVPAGTPGDDPMAPIGGSDAAGPLGFDSDAVGLGTARIIAVVTRDWDPTPGLRKTPEIVVNGTTLADVGKELDSLGEWGQAGGSLRTDAIPPGNSTNLTVALHGNLVYRLPRWSKYSSASKAAQTEWDRMFEKLAAHEDRHLAIAIEEGDTLASDLVGRDIADIASMVTDANKRMKGRQDQLDADTDHGARPGVQYGDVTLDTSIQ